MDDIACNTCFSRLYDSPQFQCGHVFCESCVIKLNDQGGSLCPYCNEKVEQRSQDDNFDIKPEVAASGLFPKDAAEGYCNDHAIPINFVCLDCNILMCVNCLMINHLECSHLKTSFALEKVKEIKCSMIKSYIQQQQQSNEDKKIQMLQGKEILDQLWKMMEEIEDSDQICHILTIEKELNDINFSKMDKNQFKIVEFGKKSMICSVNPEHFVKTVSSD